MTDVTTKWTTAMFPGEGSGIPTDNERDRADALIAEWSARWNEEPITIRRTHPQNRDVDGHYASTLAGQPTNRAYLRSQLRRWWNK